MWHSESKLLHQTDCMCCTPLFDSTNLQVVQFRTNVTSIDPERLPYKINSCLPHDIRVTWMSQTAPDFNVTVSARHKVRAGDASIDGGVCFCCGLSSCVILCAVRI